MQFRSKLGPDIFNTESVDEGHAVPYVENGETPETKISQDGDEIMIGLHSGKLRNSQFFFATSREKSHPRRRMERESRRAWTVEIMARLFDDTMLMKKLRIFDASTSRTFVKGFIVNLLLAFEVETQFVAVVREGTMVMSRSTPKRSRGG